MILLVLEYACADFHRVSGAGIKWEELVLELSFMLFGFPGLVVSSNIWTGFHTDLVTHQCKHLHGHDAHACLMVLISFGLVVPMSVLTQLLTAPLWKAFCFLNKIPVLMLPVGSSHWQPQHSDRPYGCQKQKLDLCLFLSFSFMYPFTCHHANRHSAFVITRSVLVMDQHTPTSPQVLPLSFSAPLSCCATGFWESRWRVLPSESEKGGRARLEGMVKRVTARLMTCHHGPPLVKQLI